MTFWPSVSTTRRTFTKISSWKQRDVHYPAAGYAAIRALSNCMSYDLAILAMLYIYVLILLNLHIFVVCPSLLQIFHISSILLLTKSQ